MKISTAEHIYYIGMINTLLNVHDDIEIGDNNYSSTHAIGIKLKVITKISRKSNEEKYGGLGLYPVHISVIKNGVLIGSYDSLVKLSDDVLASIKQSDVLTDEKYSFIIESKPTIVEQAQTYLRYRHQIDEADSDELYFESGKFIDIAKQLVINNCNEEELVRK